MEPGLKAEHGHGVEVCAEEPGAHGKPVGWQGRHAFSKLAYLASEVNTNLRSLRREGAV